MAKYTLPPRQKAINILYILMIAIMAINVSTDVLVGYDVIYEETQNSNKRVAEWNDTLLSQLTVLSKKHPSQFGGEVFQNVKNIDESSKRVISQIHEIKEEIAAFADEDSYQAGQLTATSNLKAVPYIMLSVAKNRGVRLQRSIDSLRESIHANFAHLDHLNVIDDYLNTSSDLGVGGREWSKKLFERQPAIGGLTVLSQIEFKLRLGVSALYKGQLTQTSDVIEASKVKRAYAVPMQNIVLLGNTVPVNVGIAADEQSDKVVINKKTYTVNQGVIELAAGNVGDQKVMGYITDEDNKQYPFDFNYKVVKPEVVVTASMMNILYAGIENPISVDMPNIFDDAKLIVKMTNGTVSNKNGHWVATPSKEGKSVVTVYYTANNTQTKVGEFSFKVKQLPDPIAYVVYNNSAGTKAYFKGSVPIEKANLLNAQQISASLEFEGSVHTFKVVEFEITLVSGSDNSVKVFSVAGDKFSAEQLGAIEQLSRGDKVYISSIYVQLPNGDKRQVSPMVAVIL